MLKENFNTFSFYMENLFSFKTGEELVEFGQYKNSNKTILQIIKEDPTYVLWCLSNLKKFKLSKKLKTIFEESLKNDNPFN